MNEPIRIDSAHRVTPKPERAAPPRAAGQSNFADVLARSEGLKFSNHARKRLQLREITLNDECLERLSHAVSKAEKRGCRDSLVLMDDLAFIVNVQERTVVTALEARSRGEGVFTQIDSVVLADTK